MDAIPSDGEEDVCRVCRLEADADNPMVHPCKCSGSVRFVHPDCLKSWLEMSQKRHCEICGYRYAFTKVYPDHLPSIIPPTVYIRQSLAYIKRVLQFAFRCWLVAMVWLILLPQTNVSMLTGTGSFFAQLISYLCNLNRSDGATATTTAEPTHTINSTLPSTTPSSDLFSSHPALERVLASQLGIVIPIIRIMWRKWLDGELLISPIHVFRSQLYTLGLGGLIIALIFTREWFSTYDWPKSINKEPPPDDVDPDEWIFADGVARRVFERTGADGQYKLRADLKQSHIDLLKEIAYPESKERRRSEGDKDKTSPSSKAAEVFLNSPAPPLARSSSSPDQKDNPPSPLAQLKPPPLLRTFSQLEQSPQTVSLAELVQVAQSQNQAAIQSSQVNSQPGPGPSTLLHRSRSKSPERQQPIVTDPVTPAPAHNTRSRMASRVEKETWRAPELLAGVGKGKGRAVQPEVAREEGHIVSAALGGQSISASDNWLPSPTASMRGGTKSRMQKQVNADEERDGGETLIRAMKNVVDAAEGKEGEEGAESKESKESKESEGNSTGVEQEDKAGSEDKVHDLSAFTRPVVRNAVSEPLAPQLSDFAGSEPDKEDMLRPTGPTVNAVQHGDRSTDVDSGSGIKGGARRRPRYDDEDGGDVEYESDDYIDIPARLPSPSNTIPSLGKTKSDEKYTNQLPAGLGRPIMDDGSVPEYVPVLRAALEAREGSEVAERTSTPTIKRGKVGGVAYTVKNFRPAVNAEARAEAEAAAGAAALAAFAALADPAAPAVPAAPAAAGAAGANAARDPLEDVPLGAQNAVALARQNEDANWEDVPDDDADEVAFEEEDAPWNADEWDQIWEVLGLTGPLSSLAQNFGLAMSIMTATMVAFVIIPMVTGRLVLAVDFVRAFIGGHYVAFRWTRGVLGWVRVVTDGIVDLVWKVVWGFVLWPLRKSLGNAVRLIKELISLGGGGAGMGVAVGEDEVEGGRELFARLRSTLGQFGDGIDQIGRGNGGDDSENVTTLSAIVQSIPYAPLFLSRASTFVDPLLDHLEILGNKTYHFYQAYRVASSRVAGSNTLRDAVVNTLVGYGASLAAMGAVSSAVQWGWVNMSAGSRDMMVRWNMFMKLCAFIALELVVFPLTVGVYINLAAMPLFPGMTLASRREAVREGLFGVLVVLWMVGTMFMYGFAQVLSWVRSMCRAGTLYFVRDPHDPNYSAVKEMIERPTRSQLRKMTVSTMMYGTVVWMLFGMFTWGLHLLPGDSLPLRLRGYGPISSTPFDYILLLLIVPPTVNSIRPRHTIKKILIAYWRAATKVFRVRSLLIGKRYMLTSYDDITQLETLLWRLLDIPAQLVFGQYDPSATLMRVPAADQVILPSYNGKRIPMFVPLDDDLVPRSREAKIRMLRQDEATRKAKREPRDDFIVVSLPRYWRTRVHAFVFGTLGFSAVFIAGVVIVPVLLGRRIIGGWGMGQVHDGYSYIVGAYAIYFAALLGTLVRRLVKLSTRARIMHRSTLSMRIKRTVGRVLVGAYAAVMVYGLHPVARGVLWELRVGLWVRHGLRGGQSVLHVWDAWALGSVLNALELGACKVFSRHRVHAVRDHWMHDIQRHPLKADFKQLTTVALPLFGKLLYKIALSFVVANVGVRLWKRDDEEFRNIAFRLSGIIVWALTEVVEKRRRILKKMIIARQGIIDAEYVVEERVDNYDATKEGKAKSSTSASGARRGGGGGRAAGRAGRRHAFIMEDMDEQVDVAEAGESDEEWEDVPDEEQPEIQQVGLMNDQGEWAGILPNGDLEPLAIGGNRGDTIDPEQGENLSDTTHDRYFPVHVAGPNVAHLPTRELVPDDSGTDAGANAGTGRKVVLVMPDGERVSPGEFAIQHRAKRAAWRARANLPQGPEGAGAGAEEGVGAVAGAALPGGGAGEAADGQAVPERVDRAAAAAAAELRARLAVEMAARTGRVERRKGVRGGKVMKDGEGQGEEDEFGSGSGSESGSGTESEPSVDEAVIKE